MVGVEFAWSLLLLLYTNVLQLSYFIVPCTRALCEGSAHGADRITEVYQTLCTTRGRQSRSEMVCQALLSRSKVHLLTRKCLLLTAKCKYVENTGTSITTLDTCTAITKASGLRTRTVKGFATIDDVSMINVEVRICLSPTVFVLPSTSVCCASPFINDLITC